MIGFVGVFPMGLALEFTFENRLWAVDEQYCVQPKCRCTESALSFLQYLDSSGRGIVSRRNVPVVRYNYRSKSALEMTPGPPGSPSTPKLLAALRTAHPSINDQLNLRHLILQSLYARQQVAEIKSVLKSLPGGSVSVPPEKTGRNDPGPCGSGKKFKKCCGR